jgi:hypothetical protein
VLTCALRVCCSFVLHCRWGKLDDLTLTCHAWEDSAADYLQIAEHYTQLQRQCHVLELKHDSAAGELAQARAEVVEKDIKLAMAVAEKTDLQNKTVDATIALEHQTTALEAMQVQSAAKLRAVESKYDNTPCSPCWFLSFHGISIGKFSAFPL